MNGVAERLPTIFSGNSTRKATPQAVGASARATADPQVTVKRVAGERVALIGMGTTQSCVGQLVEESGERVEDGDRAGLGELLDRESAGLHRNGGQESVSRAHSAHSRNVQACKACPAAIEQISVWLVAVLIQSIN